MIPCRETSHGVVAEVAFEPALETLEPASETFEPASETFEPDSETFEAAELWSRLHPVERALAAPFGSRRRLAFAAGRAALRAALERSGLSAAGPIVIGARGEPCLPDARSASVSVTHGAGVACALVSSPASPGVSVGIDVEAAARGRPGLEREVLTAGERAEIAPGDLAFEVALRFSIKEALYKALDPVLQRWVSFREVEVWPTPDGAARCRFDLRSGGAPAAADVAWRVRGGRILSTVRLEWSEAGSVATFDSRARRAGRTGA